MTLQQQSFIALAVSSCKHIVMVWCPSVCLSICPVFFLTLMRRAVHIQRDSAGGSMRRSQLTFRPDNKNDLHTWFVFFVCLVYDQRNFIYLTIFLFNYI